MNSDELQCTCNIPLNEKSNTKYDFGLLGVKVIFVCRNCLEKPPYNKYIIEYGSSREVKS